MNRKKGGHTNSTSLIEYDVDSESMVIHASLSIPVASSNSETTVNGTIYMIPPGLYWSSFATFNMKTQQFVYPWTPIQRERESTLLIAPCLTSFDDRYLVVLGGVTVDELDYEWTKEMNIYDIEKGEWLGNTKQLNQTRSAFSCEAYNGHLFVMGGAIGMDASLREGRNILHTDSVEKLYIDDIQNTNCYHWTPLPPMNERKFGTSSVMVDRFIFVIGIFI